MICYKNGDRIAQMVICPVIKTEFEIVNELPNTPRAGRFGQLERINEAYNDQIDRYKGQINLKN